ncbi:MAG TPA: hypothetical protein VN089_11775 [Duganella sp.]|nr:hypothetical protein [Duganella sp.]
MQLWNALRLDLEAAGAEVVETDFPVVDRYEKLHDGDEDFLDRGFVTRDFLDDEVGDLAVWAMDTFLRTNGDPALPRLSDADPALIFPHPPGALADRYGIWHYDISYDIGEYVSRAQGWEPDWRDVGSLEEGLRGLEHTRRVDFEQWMDAEGIDAVVFPTQSDVGPADADVNPASADIAWRNGVWVSNGNLVPRHLGIPTVTVPMGTMADLPGAREYADWLWLMNIRHYFNSREVVRANLDLLRASFQRIAALEADLALARHLAEAPRYCWAEQGPDVAMTDAVHPLLAEPSPLSFAFERRGVFVSGQNGIGKSTLLRTVGLNLIVARAFGFSYADAAVTPSLPVYSSMQNEDALEGGESLYIAELRRARELLALAGQAPAIFIIDEIFRGTNHLESISAAAAVLHTLSASGRVIVSSHNLVLAPLLAEALAPWCVSRVDGGLQLAPGVLKETNGIALLAARGFDAAISAKANRVHDWLSDYMAHPADCGAVLG